jgi:hypothetical protein
MLLREHGQDYKNREKYLFALLQTVRLHEEFAFLLQDVSRTIHIIFFTLFFDVFVEQL